MKTRPTKPTNKRHSDVTSVASMSELERFKRQAAFNAMYKYTFGIIGDYDGFEGRGIGTGVGVLWKNSHLIVTAAHTLRDTPRDRLYFMVPLETLVFADSLEEADQSKLQVNRRGQFETQQVLLSRDYDLAAVVVSPQEEETTQKHFYNLDGRASSAPAGKVVGFSGYPSCRAQPVGGNFAAFPFCDIGKVCNDPIEHDSTTEILVSYYCADEVDPHGLSGGGIWRLQKPGKVWSPEIALAGLVTRYDKRGFLIAYRAAAVFRFLRGMAA